SSSATSVFQANGSVILNGSGTSSNELVNWGNTGVTGNEFAVKGNLTLSGNGELFTSASGEAIGFLFNGAGTISSPQVFTMASSVTDPFGSFEVSNGT